MKFSEVLTTRTILPANVRNRVSISVDAAVIVRAGHGSACPVDEGALVVDAVDVQTCVDVDEIVGGQRRLHFTF